MISKGRRRGMVRRLCRRRRYEQNAYLTNRFLAAGLVPLGKTNVPELTLMPVTESRLYGPARNPWDVSRTPADRRAVRRRRWRRAWCRWRMPMMAAARSADRRRAAGWSAEAHPRPHIGGANAGRRLGQPGGGACRLPQRARFGRHAGCHRRQRTGAPYCAPPPAASYLTELANAPKGLRIALVRARPDGSAPHADCLAAVDHTAALCRSLGHHVDRSIRRPGGPLRRSRSPCSMPPAR